MIGTINIKAIAQKLRDEGLLDETLKTDDGSISIEIPKDFLNVLFVYQPAFVSHFSTWLKAEIGRRTDKKFKLKNLCFEFLGDSFLDGVEYSAKVTAKIKIYDV